MKNWAKKEIVIDMRKIVTEERFIILIIKKRKGCILSLEVYIILQSRKYTFLTSMERFIILIIKKRKGCVLSL